MITKSAHARAYAERWLRENSFTPESFVAALEEYADMAANESAADQRSYDLAYQQGRRDEAEEAWKERDRER